MPPVPKSAQSTVTTEQKRSVRWLDIGYGFAAYELGVDTRTTVQRAPRARPVSKDSFHPSEGVTTLKSLTAFTTTASAGLGNCTFKSGAATVVVQAVRPAYLDLLRDVGWTSPSSTVDSAKYESAVCNKPFTALMNGEDVLFIGTSYYNNSVQLLDGTPVPVCHVFEYIGARINNAAYDLDRLVAILRKRKDIALEKSAYGKDQYTFPIPGYNVSRYSNMQAQFRWRPEAEDWLKVIAKARTYTSRLGAASKEGAPKPLGEVGSEDIYRACFDLDIFGLRAGGAALYDDFYGSREYDKSPDHSSDEEDD